MNENLKECKILGFGKYADKETGEAKLRVLLGIDFTSENYTGIQVAPAFLDYDEKLVNDLKLYLSDSDFKTKSYYKTTDNIITGKTKVSEIILK